jgi:hypothetical protein
MNNISLHFLEYATDDLEDPLDVIIRLHKFSSFNPMLKEYFESLHFQFLLLFLGPSFT